MFNVSVNTVTSGQLLCSGLFSNDPLATWLGAIALLHSIEGNNTQKEQLLRVQLATSVGNPPVSLLQQCTNILEKVEKREVVLYSVHAHCLFMFRMQCYRHELVS